MPVSVASKIRNSGARLGCFYLFTQITLCSASWAGASPPLPGEELRISPKGTASLIEKDQSAPTYDFQISERNHFLIFNVKHKQLSNSKLRQAISLAVPDVAIKCFPDKVDQLIQRRTLLNRLEIGGTPRDLESVMLEKLRNDISNTAFQKRISELPAKHEDISFWRQNILTADRLLQEAGYTLKDGKRLKSSDGEPLTLKIATQNDIRCHLDEIILSLRVLGIVVQTVISTATLDMGISALGDSSYEAQLINSDAHIMHYYMVTTQSKTKDYSWLMNFHLMRIGLIGGWDRTPLIHLIATALHLGPQITEAQLQAIISAADRIVFADRFLVPLWVRKD